MRVTWFAAALVCLLPATPAAQTSSDPSATYVLEYWSVPIERDIALAEIFVRSIERGGDWVVDGVAGDLFRRKSTAGFFARLGRSIVFDQLIDAYGSAIAHEYSHAARTRETGRRAKVFLSPFDGGYFRIETGTPLTPLETMSVFGGGLEGQHVLAARVEDRVYERGTATAGDATVSLWTAFSTGSYILHTLSERRLQSPERLLTGRRPDMPGDPVHYVLGLSAERLSHSSFTLDDVTAFFPDIQANARSIRRRSLINLLDYGQVTMGVGLIRDYLWRGERLIPARWLALGPVAVVPSLSYRLSPIGPEARVRTRYRTGAGTGEAYVRWTERLGQGSTRLLGAGGEYQPRAIRGLTPRLGLDVWRNPDGTTGVRGEFAATFSRSPGDRLVFSGAVGAKGRGYVPAYPLKSGEYFSIGAGLRF